LVGACADPRRDAERKLGQVGVEKLRGDAARIYKDVFAGRAPAFEEVRPAVWPESFRAFAPHHVGAAPDGISLALTRSRDAESGLYIVPLQMDHTPRATPRAALEQLAEGIYWYSFQD
jgi:hypothetical protein